MKPLLDSAIEAYAFEHTRQRPAIFDELCDVTRRTMKNPEMQVGRVEGTLLKLLVGLAKAERVLEIGTFTGFSALCMAEALPEGGELITCDRDPSAAAIARSFFDRTPHGKKITIRIGDALETVKSLPTEQSFDLAFIDADKERMIAYYEEILPRLRRGGLLVADNTLWSGEVLTPDTPAARAIVQFNRRVAADERVENVLLTVRDGMMLARKN
jgi:caffeoyl-CoA O-methyltransferase